jgi:hypothetical protein
MDKVLEQYYSMVKPVSKTADDFILGQYVAQQRIEAKNKKDKKGLDKSFADVLQCICNEKAEEQQDNDVRLTSKELYDAFKQQNNL